MRDSSVVALILAKSHSRRLENKNSLPFHGKPMYLVNVEKCLELFKRVYVSSDSFQILAEAKKAGAIPIWRSIALCGDVPNIPVYQHALKYMPETEAVIAVQANSPTVLTGVISRVKDLVSCGVSEAMTCHEDRRIYGSVWGLSVDRIINYGNPYKQKPQVLVIDRSVDIHTVDDYNLALSEHEENISNC
jgi:CMP-2-keto-3-deoxyoctulosonic acid synthetase